MRDTLKIECLVQALEEYINAAREESAARDAYDGPSWGYFGRGFVEAKERAAERIQEHLDAYIDARVKDALAKHS